MIAVWVPLLLVAGYFVYTFNRLVSHRNACSNARASIDVNLTRRHELIQNLVSVVRGYAAHEQRTFVELAATREHAMARVGTSESAAAEAQVERALGHLLLRVEAYPDLKADEIFVQLMRNLTETEEQISASRRAFNGQVLRLNDLVQQFPSLIVANVTGFRVLAPYSARDEDRLAPAVNLASTSE